MLPLPGPSVATRVSQHAVFNANETGRRWGILVCNDGVYPYYTGDWSQLDDLKAQGADAFIWSVGGMVPIGDLGSHTARKYGVDLIASEDKSDATGSNSGQILGKDGKKLSSQRDVAFRAPAHYTASDLHVRLAVLL